MQNAVIIEGHFDGEKFIPDGPMPPTSGSAQLVVTPDDDTEKIKSIADLIGHGKLTSDEIDERMKEIHAGWEDSPELPEHSQHSIAVTFGKGTRLRTSEEINAQIREERDSWGDR